MKNLTLLLFVISIWHTTAGDFNGGAGWGHEENDDLIPPWWRRTTARPISTTRTTTTTRKPSKEQLIATCLRGCPVTSEYNPVCGTNNVTYDNPGRLECAQQCGVDVQISRRVRCEIEEVKNLTRNSIESCVRNCPIPKNFMATCGTNDVTYASPERLICVQGCGVVVQLDNYHPCYRYPNQEDSLVALEFKVCHQVCSSNNENKPICGTDGRDYNNHEHLHCARKCGINVNIRSNNKCIEHPYKTTAKPVVEPSTPVTPVIEPSTPKPEVTTKPNKVTDIKVVTACMQHCPLTSDCLPVCGTDGITYRNPGQLLCSQFCGIDVRVKEFEACPYSKAFTNCPRQPKIDEEKVTVPPPPPTEIPVEACLLSCPATKVYAPVCGSDGKTYNNVDELICARNCGVEVWMRKQLGCDDFVTPPTTTTEEYDIDVRFGPSPQSIQYQSSNSVFEEITPLSITSSPSIDSPISTDISLDNSSTNVDSSSVSADSLASTENSTASIDSDNNLNSTDIIPESVSRREKKHIFLSQIILG